MVRPASKKHAGEKAITVFSNEVWYDAKAYYQDPDSDHIDKWKQRLSSMDQVTIANSFRASQALRALGYDFSTAGYSPTTWLLGVGRSQFLRYYRALPRRLGQYLRRPPRPSP